MKIYRLLLFAFFATTLFTSCFEDMDDVSHPPSNLEIKNFVYNGLYEFYLYKADKEVLTDNHFSNQTNLNNFLEGYATPELLFNGLLSTQDRFSFITSDYTLLERALDGISKNNGMEFGLVRLESTGEVFGYVRYVLPHSSASENNVKRGMIFNRIDGTALNENNYTQLLDLNTYSIGLAEFNGGQLNPNEQEITLAKQEYTENPVYKDTVLTVQNHKIGYLMYNSFNNTFDNALNNAFGNFKAEGITDLVLDLRYNGGGSIETANDLCSMINGQLDGKLFITQVYNQNIQDTKRFFNTKISNGATINSLNLSKIYVLTTQSTASASELILSGLRPYVDIEQIGTTTIGKFQGSITLYDSSDFSRQKMLPGHTYAMQPLILKSVNAEGFTDYADGIDPDIELPEDYSNLGALGDPTEPLLQAAIQNITTGGRPFGSQSTTSSAKLLYESKSDNIIFQRMYVEEK